MKEHFNPDEIYELVVLDWQLHGYHKVPCKETVNTVCKKLNEAFDRIYEKRGSKTRGVRGKKIRLPSPSPTPPIQHVVTTEEAK